MPPSASQPSTRTARKQIAAPSIWRGRARRDQFLACTIGVALLVCSALLHARLNAFRHESDLIREDPESEKTLRALAVNFPRLTLGGMRGVLSTVLWIQAEEDKNERRWIDLETKYDIIGALQPYFSSVYVYHSWNQAYNLSAQWQEQHIKYKWVLDGIAYLYKGEDYNPGNPDIILELGHLYFLKLGGSFERIFYREHWRHDLSRLHELNDKSRALDDDTVSLKRVREFIHRKDARDGQSYFHARELPSPGGGAATGWGIEISDPVVDPKTGFNLFKGRTDGRQATEPVEFRYGVSPFYFAYAEYKRCLSLKMPPTYTGLRVIDAWPAMSLRLWCRDDLYYLGDTMRRMFGRNPDSELLTSDMIRLKSAEMTDCHRNVLMIAPRAVDLFHDHLARYPNNVGIHTKHILETQAYADVMKAEHLLFQTLIQWHLADRKMDPVRREEFLRAETLYRSAYVSTMKWVDNMYPIVAGEEANPDRADYEKFAIAIQHRSRGIQNLLSPATDAGIDLSFLEEDVIER